MWNWLKKAEELRNQGTSFALISVTRVTGSAPSTPGTKMLVLQNGHFFGTIGGGNLEYLIIEEARTAIRNRKPSYVARYPLGAKAGQCCGGIMEVLLETINCSPNLFLFGAGHVGQAVSQCMIGTPFSIHLIDPRPEWIHAPEIPREVIRHAMDWNDFVVDATWDEKITFVAVMTHRHDIDQDIIQNIIQRPARYIGLIGSHSKWIRFKQRLMLRGIQEDTLARVRSPLGLPIGGKAPQEVAISLAAELLKIYYDGVNSL